MSRWAEHHDEASDKAAQAESAARTGDTADAVALYGLAADAELRALDALDPAKIRTLGVTVVSAFWLLRKAGRAAEAERLTARWLADDRLPPFARGQLDTQRQEPVPQDPSRKGVTP